MKLLNRYLMREILGSTLFVLAALLSLFAFFDLIHELGDMGKGGYRLKEIFVFVALSVPGHVYELFPTAALIGTLFALAKLVANSEFTVMRVSGLSIHRMGFWLVQISVLFVLITFVFGEFIAPWTERTAQQLKLKSMHSVVAEQFRSGLWVKDGSSFVNVKEIRPDSTLVGVNVYRFDRAHRLTDIRYAQKGTYLGRGEWRLKGVVDTYFENGRTRVSQTPQADWHSVLTPSILSVLLVVPDQMSAWSLYSYIQHLRENHQSATRYAIALWSKLSSPLAVMVMMLLALPFAYHRSRTSNVSSKVFAGIMLGLGFNLFNRLFAHLGLLNDWPPMFSAMFPTIFFLALALAMMWWVERV
ncbi:MAG: LPS export ABC transporter permease LptG [Betaproteobacteria bacterium]|nr:LPS export ABC transporter permease LptG [Betaproteobacteria bacterium]